MLLDREKAIKKIEKKLKKHNRKGIDINYLYTVVAESTDYNEDDLRTIEYEIFYGIVNNLIDQKIIKPKGKKVHQRGNRVLSEGYWNLVKEQSKALTEDDKLFLHSLNKNIEVTTYFRDAIKLEEDREKLKILSDFLNENKEVPFMRVNERSYELFGYEKELVNENKGLLNRVNVPLDELRCYPRYTPLQCHIFKNFYNKNSRVILIVENQDTYLSLLGVSQETNLENYLDMVIYGGGNKVTGNFKQHTIYSISRNDKVYYFGDIDPEGLAIYKGVKEANPELDIKLCKYLYKLAIKIGIEKGLKDIHNNDQRMLSNDEMDLLLAELDNEVATKFKEIIYNGKYIPQEAVNYSVLLNEINLIDKGR